MNIEKEQKKFENLMQKIKSGEISNNSEEYQKLLNQDNHKLYVAVVARTLVYISNSIAEEQDQQPTEIETLLLFESYNQSLKDAGPFSSPDQDERDFVDNYVLKVRNILAVLSYEQKADVLIQFNSHSSFKTWETQVKDNSNLKEFLRLMSVGKRSNKIAEFEGIANLYRSISTDKKIQKEFAQLSNGDKSSLFALYLSTIKGTM